MKKLQLSVMLLIVLSVLFVTAFGNTVAFDSSYNGNGYSILPIVSGQNYSLGNSFAIQSDGKIVIAGNIVRNNQQDEFALARINTDGSLDTSFGTNGIVSTTVGTSDSASKVRILSDGKILLAGSSWTEGQAYNIMLVRYNSDGSLDTTFHTTGYLSQNINGGSYDYPGDFAVLSDGKIVVVGGSGATQLTDNILIMRFNEDGSLDSTFDGDGILTMTTTAGGAAGPIIIQSDGKYLIGGYRNDGTKPNFLLMRLNPDGTLDGSFGTNGTTISSVSPDPNYISAIDRQSDGKIIAAGSNFIVRYTPDGILDTTFGTSGSARTPSVYETTGVRVAAGDKILVSSRGVYRFLPNGVLDTRFNNGGFRSMGSGNITCTSSAVEIQTDGKIVLGGSCGTPSNFTVARFQETRTKRFMDFNGNDLTDVSIFRPSNGQWWYLNGSSQIVVGQFGTATDLPVPADFTGDGRTDVAVFRPSTGEWFVLRSEDNSFYSFPFGTSGDIPVAADYDGDDKADAAVFRPSSNQWYIQMSTGGTFITTFGAAGDKPVPSDYDGDYKTDIAIYRPSSGQWWIQRSSDSNFNVFQFGTATDKPVPGDYTGDNKTDAAFWRPSTGEWFVLRSEDFSYYSVPFGLSDDLPTPGNYAGDGKYDFAVYRPSTNAWHVQPNGGSYFYRVFGQAGDVPLENGFVP